LWLKCFQNNHNGDGFISAGTSWKLVPEILPDLPGLNSFHQSGEWFDSIICMTSPYLEFDARECPDAWWSAQNLNPL
jgi:hypothetical protein